MNAKLLGSISVLVAGAGLALSQTPTNSPYRVINRTNVPTVIGPPHEEPADSASGRATVSLAPADGAEAEDEPTPTLPATPAATLPAPAAAPEHLAPTTQAAPIPANTFQPGPGQPFSPFWVNTEYLVWWTKSTALPVLATSAPAQFANTEVPPGQFTAVFGGGHLDYQAYSGVRFTAGYYLDGEGTTGIDANYFMSETRIKSFFGGSVGSPLFGPAFFDTTTGKQSIVKDADPNGFIGTVSVVAPSQFWGSEANYSVRVRPVFADHLRLFAGFRYFELSEAITRQDEASGFGPNLGIDIRGFDHFGTRNQFYAGQIGFAAHSHMGQDNKWTLDVIGKFAMGGIRQIVNIDGASVLIQPGQPTLVGNGNLLALPSNIGHFQKSRFAMMPELTVNMGYQLTSRLSAFMGYNLFYLDRVVRPASQIDFVVNSSQVTFLAGSPGVLQGVARPAPLFHNDSFWAQGLNFGLSFTY